jgi:undecaprenyl-diphosphatase
VVQRVVTSGETATKEESWLQRARTFVVARFDPDSHLGLGLTLRLVACGLAVWAFSGLLDAVLDNETLVRVDQIIAAWFHDHATPSGLAVFNVVTQLGSPVADGLIGIVALYLLWRREYPLLLSWLGATLGGKVIEYVVKNTVHRSRPQYAAAYLHGASYSFPSGHTMTATVCYLTLAYLVAARPGANPRARWAHIVAVVIIIAVAFSRLYLGVHYLSDVLGGFAAGFAWLTLCGATRHLITRGRAFRSATAH